MKVSVPQSKSYCARLEYIRPTYLNIKYQKQTEFLQTIQEQRQQILVDSLQRLLDYMSKWCQTVKEVKGYATEYWNICVIVNFSRILIKYSILFPGQIHFLFKKGINEYWSLSLIDRSRFATVNKYSINKIWYSLNRYLKIIWICLYYTCNKKVHLLLLLLYIYI